LALNPASNWGQLNIGFNSQVGNFTSGTFYTDNLSVVAVPEPSSFLCVAVGGFVCVAGARRQRRQAAMAS
jgi:hypothetical protein